MVVVADTSPITYLIKSNRLHYLELLFGKIYIPRGVYAELIEFGDQKRVIDNLSWIIVLDEADKELLSNIVELLDRGESEAIVLAKEIKADTLIIDEARGRYYAGQMGINFIGLLGILATLKERGLIHEIRPILDDLRTNHGFWLSKKVYNEFLRAKGE